MSKTEEVILKELSKRLKLSNPKKWKQLNDEERSLIVRKYYEIRDADYKNITFLLREHADNRRQFSILFVGVLIGVLANPISTIISKYLPSATMSDDLLNLTFFALILSLLVLTVNRSSAEWLGDENVIERLLEIVKQTSHKNDFT
jgi:hypothetical protein